MITAIRLALTTALVVAVYLETGPWTALAFAVLFFGGELRDWIIRRSPSIFERHQAAEVARKYGAPGKQCR